MKEGHFWASFLVEGEPKNYLQSVRRSYKRGVKAITLAPGDSYEETFKVHAKDWGNQQKMKPGVYALRVHYEDNRNSVVTTENGVEAGVIKTLVSDQLMVRIM